MWADSLQCAVLEVKPKRARKCLGTETRLASLLLEPLHTYPHLRRFCSLQSLDICSIVGFEQLSLLHASLLLQLTCPVVPASASQLPKPCRSSPQPSSPSSMPHTHVPAPSPHLHASKPYTSASRKKPLSANSAAHHGSASLPPRQ